MTTKDIFISKSKKIFGELYVYDNVIYKTNKDKVELICREHGVFNIRPDMHLCRKAGCITCSFRKRSKLFINKNWLIDFQDKHGSSYDYTKVNYVNNKTKVEIVCSEHGSFFMRPNSHLNGQGCPRCSKSVFNTDDFIIYSNNIHDFKYDYTNVVYEKSITKAEIICKQHGSFFMMPSCHLNGQGCPKCGKLSIAKQFKNNITDVINDFRKIHGDRFDYSIVDYKNSNSKVKIICKEHGVFEQSSKSHINGSSCPLCKGSKGERIISQFLIESKIEFKAQKTFNGCMSNIGNRLKFDFYLPTFNLCIEYDGEQHFKSVDYFGGEESFTKMKFNDNVKSCFCLENGIGLLRISFSDYKNIKNILSEIVQ